MEKIENDLGKLKLRSVDDPSVYWYIVAKSKTKLQVYKFFPRFKANKEDILELFWEEDDISQSFSSNSGQYICIQRIGCFYLEIIDIESRSVITKVEYPKDSSLKIVEFSPLDTYFVVLTAWTEHHRDNLSLYKLLDCQKNPIISVPYPKIHAVKKLPLWTPGEEFCLLNVMSSINVWKGNDFTESGFLGKLSVNLENNTKNSPLPNDVVVSISPVNKKGQCFIGIFIPNQGKIDRGALKIYSIANLEGPTFSEHFEQAEEADFFWNKNATAVALRTFTNNVRNLSSYYGGNGLYLIHTSKRSCITISTPSEGMVHDLSWSKRSNELLISKGRMPAELESYDGNNGKKLLTFGKGNRNTIRRDPFDRLLLLAGFGNLAGEIDIWDTKIGERIAQSRSGCSVFCEFSPDGRYFVTATTVPRMRVDCCFKIFSYCGELLTKMDFEELHHIDIKSPKIKFSERDPSPDSKVRSNTLKGGPAVYRPPGSTGNRTFKSTSRDESSQNTVAVQVAKKQSQAEGPPGADAALLSAAVRIRRKKNQVNKNQTN